MTGLGDTESRRRIFICRPASPAEEDLRARRSSRTSRSRRSVAPVTDEDLKAPMSFYAMGHEQGGFEAGIEGGLTAILSSTKFLFRAEPGESRRRYRRPREGSLLLRARWTISRSPRASPSCCGARCPTRSCSTPRPAGKLRDDGGHARADPPHAEGSDARRRWSRTSRSSGSTSRAWTTSSRRRSSIRTFDVNLRQALHEEIRLFLDSVLRSDRSVLDLLASDITYLNERVALHYGMKNIRGAQFRPVKLADPNRWGLLGKGALLMSTSYGNRTSPVLRGAVHPRQHHGYAAELAAAVGAGVSWKLRSARRCWSVRERLEAHRANLTCNGCHGVIDPLGFALENFDVTGAWRTKDLDAGVLIDAAGHARERHEGGLAGTSCAKALLARPDQFVQALTEKLMTFALGRSLRYQDMPTVRAIVRKARWRKETRSSRSSGVSPTAPAFRHEGTCPARP